MKRLLNILLPAVMVALISCNSDEPQNDKDNGFLAVTLIQEGATEDVDFSDYNILIMSEYGGAGWVTPYKEISWPISRPAGEYLVIAESPLVSETESLRYYYTAMERNVPIVKDKTTELTLTLKFQGFPKD